MATSALPASRLDALSVILGGVFSSLLESAPKRDEHARIVLTVAANVWAIFSSFLTLQDMMNASTEIETHLWMFMVGLLNLSVVSSVLAILAFLGCVRRNKKLYYSLGAFGMAVIMTTLVVGLVELYMTYSQGCQEAVLKSAALCKHSKSYVLIAVIVAGMLAWNVSLLISAGDVNGVLVEWGKALLPMYRLDPNEEDEPHSVITAVLNRTSAFVKVCLLGVYWFLVDADMSWNTFNGHPVSWWVTGQWAKHGVAIANRFYRKCSR